MALSYVAELAGVRFRPSGFGAIETEIDDALSAGHGPLTIGYVNPHVITSAAKDAKIVEHLADCDHVCVDGTGVWLALRLWRFGIERLTAYRGADELIDAGVLRGPTAVIGIEPDQIERAATGLVERNASIDIVGLAHGYRTDAEIVAMVEDSEPRLVLIGAGSPRSEQIALIVREAAPEAVIFHVGAGTLKAWAGERSHAPRILSLLAFEWLYRFAKEPHTRSRYRRGIPEFIRLAVSKPSSMVAVPVTAKVDQSDIRQEEGIAS